MHEIDIRKKMTAYDLLKLIHKFYKKPRTIAELQILDDDVFEYRENAINDIKAGKKRGYINVMGDLIFFEGFLCKIRDRKLYLLLGS